MNPTEMADGTPASAVVAAVSGNGGMAGDLAAASPPASSPAVCRNCGAPVSTPFCGECGQPTADRLLSVPDLLSDILEDQLSVNGSAARTVGPLLFRPGFLTQEYLDGRIVRYVAPFRLFLLSTALWLFAGALVLHLRQPQIEAMARAHYADMQARQKRFTGSASGVMFRAVPFDSAAWPRELRPLGWYLLRKQAQLNARGPAGAAIAWVNAQQRSFSTLAVLLVPAVAGLLKLIYFRRRRLFAEHVVFALHFHAFAFLAMAGAMLLTLLWTRLQIVGLALIGIYLLLAMKRVYGDRWPGTLGHAAGLVALYAAMLWVSGPVVAMFLISLT